MVGFFLDELYEIFFDLMMDLLIFMINILIGTTTAIFENDIFILILRSVGNIAILMTGLGTILTIYQFFNNADNTNSGMINLNPFDYVKSVIFGFVFSVFYIDISISIFNMIIGMMDDILKLSVIEDSFDAEWMGSVPKLFMFVALILLILNSWKIFSRIITISIHTLIIIIKGINNGYYIAQGETNRIGSYFFSLVNTLFAFVFQLFFFSYGLNLIGMSEFSTLNNFILGLGLIIVSGNIEKIFQTVGLDMKLGVAQGASKASTAIGGVSKIV